MALELARQATCLAVWTRRRLRRTARRRRVVLLLLLLAAVVGIVGRVERRRRRASAVVRRRPSRHLRAAGVVGVAGERVVARWRRGERGVGVRGRGDDGTALRGSRSRYGARWRQLPHNVSCGVVRNKDGRDAPHEVLLEVGQAANKRRTDAVPPDSALVCMQTVRCRPPRATSKLSTVSWYGLPVPC